MTEEGNCKWTKMYMGHEIFPPRHSKLVSVVPFQMHLTSNAMHSLWKRFPYRECVVTDGQLTPCLSVDVQERKFQDPRVVGLMRWMTMMKREERRAEKGEV